jgi:outer membrane protein assembly factor BamB
MIELDLSRPWDADDPLGLGERGPVYGWRNPPPWLVPALLAVLIVAVLGGAAAPSRRDPILAQRVANAGLAFGRDDTAFVYQQRTRSGRVQAYRLDRPGVLWSVEYPGGNPVPTVTTDPGIVLVSVYSANPSQPVENRIEARDSRTGRRLWQRSGVGIVDVSGAVVVVTDYRGWSGNAELTEPGTVEALEVRSGVTRWSHSIDHRTLLAIERTLPPGPHGDPEPGTDGIAELDQEGVLRVLDPGTGTARSTVRLALSGPPLGLMMQDGIAVVSGGRPGDDPLSQTSGPVSVIGYEVQTGHARWHTQAPDFAQPCGARYLCEYSQSGLTVTDAKTGDVRYRGPIDRHSFRGDFLLASRSVPSGGLPSGSELWNLATGRKLRSFGSWYIVNDDPRDGDLVAQTGLYGLLMVAVLDRRTGNARVIGRARDWIGDPYCTFGHHYRYLGCSGGGGVRIWRVPDGLGPIG